MKVHHKQQGDEGSFYVSEDGANVAEMFYNMVSPNVMSIYHTEVEEAMQGRHIGYELVEAGVKYARQHSLKIEPACSFAQSIFEKEEDFADVLA